MPANTADHEIFEAGDLDLQSGETLRGAKLAYKTYGQLNAGKDNVVVFPTFFGGRHTQNEGMIGEGRALDPDRYFIIVPNLFGNGVSSSPSNATPPHNRARFPGVSLYDNVACQHRLVTEVFGIDKIALVTGWSMGAQQTYQWGALYPDMVERIVPVCGSAKTSRHNFVFLEGVKAAITADSDWAGGSYEKPPLTGLRAMGRVYAGWAVSQAFYREEVYLGLGYASLEDYLVNFWEARRTSADANDLLLMIWTWQNADISGNHVYGGDFGKALGAIKAKAIVMPGRTDLYFPPEDNEIEVAQMPNAELRPIESIWGHLAGGPGFNPVDSKFVDDALKEILAS
ncbi:MAG: alpha/beta fold hydrolase [Chloroflexi bacterium]|nr:alpha/beta fold hydrolase [Chloroflexota bacterium]